MKVPGIDETVQAGEVKTNGTGQAGADGAVSATVTQTLASVSLKFDVDPKAIRAARGGGDAPASDAQPFSVNVKTGSVTADVKLDGLKTHPLLDLWAFLVAHPSRPELAANEAAFKSLLAAALASQAKAEETASVETVAAQIPQGQITIDSAKFGVSGALAPTGAFGEHFEANGLTLPAGLVPAPFVGFAPTAFAIGFRASGFDVASASAEMVADLHLAGDGPAIAPDDAAKIRAKLIGPDGVVVDIEPSHIVAPLLDVSFEGHIVYKGGKPTGEVTVHMRNFDKTQAALKTLGLDVDKKGAMALTLAKNHRQDRQRRVAGMGRRDRRRRRDEGQRPGARQGAVLSRARSGAGRRSASAREARRQRGIDAEGGGDHEVPAGERHAEDAHGWIVAARRLRGLDLLEHVGDVDRLGHRAGAGGRTLPEVVFDAGVVAGQRDVGEEAERQDDEAEPRGNGGAAIGGERGQRRQRRADIERDPLGQAQFARTIADRLQDPHRRQDRQRDERRPQGATELVGREGEGDQTQEHQNTLAAMTKPMTTIAARITRKAAK